MVVFQGSRCVSGNTPSSHDALAMARFALALDALWFILVLVEIGLDFPLFAPRALPALHKSD